MLLISCLISIPFLLTYIDVISTLKFFSMQTTDCSIEISGVPAVCKPRYQLTNKLETAPENLQPRTKPVETHYMNTYFLQSPWQKCLLSQIKRLFPPSPIAMLFAVTQEMHAWAAKPKQHCIRGGEGGEFVSFGHDGTMARNWNCIEMSQQFCPGL